MDNDVIQRYLPLIAYLEQQGGYGTYQIKVHGKRPVKVAVVKDEKCLDPVSLER